MKSCTKRYERQGLLVEKHALEQAEGECLADKDVRIRRMERNAERHAEINSHYVKKFAMHIRELFPGCPKGREVIIAEHACLKYSGRIGRTSAAKKFDAHTVRLAVIAHLRHTETDYDVLISKGYDRSDARYQVEDKINSILSKW